MVDTSFWPPRGSSFVGRIIDINDIIIINIDTNKAKLCEPFDIVKNNTYYDAVSSGCTDNQYELVAVHYNLYYL